jgi:hypothetical protein
LGEVNKKRLFSEIKFDRKDLISGVAENDYMKGCLKMKRFYSMSGEKLWEEFGAKAESSELDFSSPATYEAQKETFSCEFLKMRTSDIVQCQNQKNV